MLSWALDVLEAAMDAERATDAPGAALAVVRRQQLDPETVARVAACLASLAVRDLPRAGRRGWSLSSAVADLRMRCAWQPAAGRD